MHFKTIVSFATAVNLLLGVATLRAEDNDVLLNLPVRKHIHLERSTNPRSTSVTFGDDTAAGPGPFGKNSDSINVGQAYFGSKGFKGLTLIAGKMPNPFITSSMVWDGDINPKGLAEQYKVTNAITANLTYAHGWRIHHGLDTGGVGDLGINPDDYNLFQADLA